MASPSSTVPILRPPVLVPIHSNFLSSSQPSPSSYTPESVEAPRPAASEAAVRTDSAPEGCISPNAEKLQRTVKLAAVRRTGPVPEGYVRMKSGVLKTVEAARATNWRGVVGTPWLLESGRPEMIAMEGASAKEQELDKKRRDQAAMVAAREQHWQRVLEAAPGAPATASVFAPVSAPVLMPAFASAPAAPAPFSARPAAPARASTPASASAPVLARAVAPPPALLPAPAAASAPALTLGPALAPVRAPTTGWTRLAPLPAPVPTPAPAPAAAQAPGLAPALLPAIAPTTAPTIAQETASRVMASPEARVQPAVTAQRAEEAQGSGTEERPAEDGSQDRNAVEYVAGPADDSARRRRSISSTINVLPRESPDTSATATSSVRDRYTRSSSNYNNNNNNKVLKKKTPMKRRHAPRAKIACLRCGQDERNYDQRKPECERCSRGSFVCTWPRGLPGPRQRVCMRCRQQKMQCDESKPACGKCCRSRSVCVWPEEIATKHGRERHSVSPSPQPLALAPTLFEHNMSSQESRVPNSFCISLEPEY
ncbi:hypothetical protein B0J12DRAFT_690888 [Macrophomina phaseolina]|uniref:Zn(2)-C6 fungal-type domain-containing protein n=1 Tax=Macrophomina phaseolina TaxID=35725 RepID=A0ABQ8FQE1_9PEZI|nr:hypothetical protein B0J12DRAFT_690888 [Macrophomina phaseolina]